MAAARALIDNPRIRVTDVEARIGTRYTAETLRRLQARAPGRALRLDHGVRQPRAAPPLARLAAHHGDGAGRGGGAARREAARRASPRPPARYRGAQLNERDARALARARAARLGGAEPAALAAVLVGDPGAGRLAAMSARPLAQA